ncbi:YihY/virulence factor BrkB family protein [Blastococcus saxobsidens]|uniref:YihY/virulence factor BrkB family protein n=1 Tax=Blastococcus saxobsidens TaxID=138336 RepID=A0A6L9W5Y8_9ACTN|nr:YihY/virulence factor BrkB family protein [Blastococcus saxobsidens]NEK86831.1 YihY/virulence factor BrkB family protein [Blastococcus saxobsidens]
MASVSGRRRTGGRAGRDPRPSDAASPFGIPAQGWRHVLRRVAAHVFSDRLMVQAAGVAFFAVLSIAPVLVTAISVYGAVSTPDQALQQLSGVVRMLPTELEPLVADQLTTITTASTQVLTLRGLAGLVVALSTAATAVSYLIDGLTLAYHETETRSFLRRTATALVMVLGGALLLGAVIAGAGAASRWLQDAPGLLRAVAPVLTWGAVALLMSAVLALLYRFGPDRKDARWRWITGGSTVATVLWLATTIGLFTYVETLGSYESTYGPLAGVAISMFWLWATVLLVLLGATVNAETERETSRDSTVGPDQPLGERGAVVADSAPPYPGEE